ncbi:putative toxin-antitoxin system toxin component, PIN family [Candidatus Microgenomates bacterium]|nr:putative toxin-antitoxin system toxin component, PIN family [Candidatus Microgenomates bacterium]
MARRVFVDTSAWISYCLTRQPKHSTVKSLIKHLSKDKITICTSNDIIDETVTRLIYNANIEVVQKFITVSRKLRALSPEMN